MDRQFTDQEVTDMDLATAETEVSNAVYAATNLIERLENAGKLRGNGHHARQACAVFATQEVRARWNDAGEVAKRAESHGSLKAEDLSAQR
jgi:hypothetical protein